MAEKAEGSTEVRKTFPSRTMCCTDYRIEFRNCREKGVGGMDNRAETTEGELKVCESYAG